MNRKIWHITKQTMNKGDLNDTLKLIINYYNVENEEQNFVKYWKNNGRTEESHRNKIIAKYFGLIYTDDSQDKNKLTPIGEKFLENITDDIALAKIIEDQKTKILLNIHTNRNDDDENLYEYPLFHAFLKFLVIAHDNDVAIGVDDYKFYVSTCESYEKIDVAFDELVSDRKNNVNIKEEMKQSNLKYGNIRHHQLWYDSKYIRLNDGKFELLSYEVAKKIIDNFENDNLSKDEMIGILRGELIANEDHFLKYGKKDFIIYICEILIEESRRLTSREIYDIILKKNEVRTTTGEIPELNYIKTLLEENSEHNRENVSSLKKLIQAEKDENGVYFSISQDTFEVNLNKITESLTDDDGEILKKKIANVRDANRQSKWSKKIREKWGNVCQFCSIEVKTIIQAAHIRDIKDRKFYDDNNGMPLCMNCHRLFDSDEITVDHISLQIHVANHLAELFNFDKIKIPQKVNAEEFCQYLKERNESD